MKKTTILFMLLFVFISNAALSQVTNYSFTAGTAIYTSITGTSPVLTGDGTDPIRDEGFANNIPLGFTFNYLGVNYNTISASTNGYAAFGTITTPGFSNNLAIGGTGRPVVAPLWEDIALATSADLQYTTIGTAGARVFVLQWANVFFDFGANNTSLSFQLRLYETTNVIEFIYNQLSGPVQDFSGGASIGITGSATGSGNFLSLNNSSASPAVSSLVAVNTITTRPAAGQVYTFTPPSCIAPGAVNITNITTTGATFTWTGTNGATNYEYAVSNSAIPPVGTGTDGSAGPLSLTGLIPGTQYYIHIRTNCGGVFSGWNSFGFATVCDAATIPYTMPISEAICPALPLCTSVSDVNQDGNTWQSYPSGGEGWTDQVLAYVYNINGTTGANDWLFTRGINLEAGTYYRLKFKYNNDHNSLYAEKLKVAYGNLNSPAAMTNILADYPSVFSSSPKTAIIDFTPATSGVYYIGFQAYSDANKDVLILDDISVYPRPSCEMPDTLSASVAAAGTLATVSWTAPSFGSPAGYEYAVVTSAAPPASGTATTLLSVVANDLLANTQYYLHVRSNCGAVFSAWATFPFATVGNDAPCNAITLTNGGTPDCGNNELATSSTDPTNNCSYPDHTVWYKYTATSNGTVVLHLTTPGAPANPLHGWVGWYQRSADCPDIALYAYGFCSEFGNNGNNDADDLISPVLTAGTTYYIMIDGYSDDVGEFCISIPACSPAVAVHVDNILGSSARVSWAGTGTYILEYGLAGFTPGTGADAGTGGTIIIPATSPKTITGLNFSTTYDVYLRRNCTSSGNGYSNNSTKSTFTTKGPPPSNDDCSGATVLTVYDSTCLATTAGTTLDATASSTTPFPSCGNEPGGYDDDVWYSFTPAAGQIYVNIDFTTTGGYTDIAAQIYKSSNNTCAGTFSLFSCNDDGTTVPGSPPRFISLAVTPGTTYFIRVFSDTINVSSQFTICITKAPPPNDNAAGAVKITVDAGCTGALYSNIDASQSIGEPAGTCSSIKGYATVWYKFIAPAGGAVKISTAAGSGNTLTNTRVALFAVTNASDYSTFSIIACDEDGGSGSFGSMSVLYASGLTDYNTYYIQVDKYDSAAATGTFCLTVEKLRDTMLSVTDNCNSVYKTPVGSVATYNGWVPLMDESSKLIALVKNPAGGPVNGYSVVENVNTGAVRKDIVSGEYYLNRSFTINNTANPNAIVNVQLFFLANELSALKAVDPAASLSKLRVTKQTATACQPEFAAANGINSELSQVSSGSNSYVGWITVNSSGFANYYIHSVKSYLSAKVFLQGAYNPDLGRHKDVTPAWANVLNSYAKNQPYNTIANADTAREGFGATNPGGTGQQVVHVTNLNSSGPGSLYAAMGSNRIIVFDVAGTIFNFGWPGDSPVNNLTIDGSTAPSPGITIDNNSKGDCLSFDGADCHDIIVKNLRIRNAGADGINCINGAHDIVFDHCSVSGSRDGNLDITTGAYNITVQYCILGGGNAGWAGNMLIGYSPVRNVSVHHTLFASVTPGEVAERNPMINWIDGAVPDASTLVCDFRNNLVWKWGRNGGSASGYGTAVCYKATANVVNNYYYSTISPQSAVDTSDGYSNGATGKAYVSGNVSGNSGINPNNVSNVVSPWAAPAVTTQDVCTAMALILARSGVRPLDETDQALINSVSLANCQGYQNQAPIANGGANITIALPANSVVLNGSGTDEDGTVVSYAWTKTSGPSTYTIANNNTATAMVSDLVQGTYNFRLTVTDSDGGTGIDNIRVIVVNTGSNQTPVANAGTTIRMTLPGNSTTLTGSGADGDGTINSYSWSWISGPGTFSLGTSNEAVTALTDLVQGTYVFRLTVVDNNNASGTDNITVIVSPATAANTSSYGSYTGTETVPDGFFTSTAATTDITDWAMLEIKNVSGSIVSRRSAFIREDGNIVDLDGVSPVSLDGLAGGNNYNLVIRHRNHLNIRTSSPLSFTSPALGLSAALTSYDFTTSQSKAFQNTAITTNGAMKDLGGGVFGVWGGNANSNSSVRASGPPVLNDYTFLFSTILSGSTGPGISNVYSTADLNMDGTVRASGPLTINDFSYFITRILNGNVGTIYTEHH